MRDLHQDSGAVARVRLAATGAAMIQVYEHLNALLDNIVGLRALDVHDKADTARVMLKTRIIKALPGRKTVPAGLGRHEFGLCWFVIGPTSLTLRRHDGVKLAKLLDRPGRDAISELREDACFPQECLMHPCPARWLRRSHPPASLHFEPRQRSRRDHLHRHTQRKLRQTPPPAVAPTRTQVPPPPLSIRRLRQNPRSSSAPAL